MSSNADGSFHAALDGTLDNELSTGPDERSQRETGGNPQIPNFLTDTSVQHGLPSPSVSVDSCSPTRNVDSSDFSIALTSKDASMFFKGAPARGGDFPVTCYLDPDSPDTYTPPQPVESSQYTHGSSDAYIHRLAYSVFRRDPSESSTSVPQDLNSDTSTDPSVRGFGEGEQGSGDELSDDELARLIEEGLEEALEPSNHGASGDDSARRIEEVSEDTNEELWSTRAKWIRRRNLNADPQEMASDKDSILKTRKDADGTFHCPHQGCSSKFTRRFNLKMHYYSVHREVRQFSCRLCNAAFNRKYDLKRHVKHRHESPKQHKKRRLQTSTT
ncbi:hypothetical protein HK102_007608 [Quaeritorhiza haematococci]|nr:hypothetical protein HK102_007608 [Quaeritorhiza haematococci]